MSSLEQGCKMQLNMVWNMVRVLKSGGTSVFSEYPPELNPCLTVTSLLWPLPLRDQWMN